MMYHKIHLAANAFLFVGCVFILQKHAIPFWQTIDGEIGLYFSLLLEMLALWHWWHRKVLLGAIISFLLILGPLLQVASPMVQQIQKNFIDQELIELNKQALEENKMIIQKLAMSDWAGMLKRSMEQKQLQEVEYKSMLESQKGSIYTWMSFVLILMHAVGLIVLLLTQIHLLRTLKFATTKNGRYGHENISTTFHRFGNDENAPEHFIDENVKIDLQAYATQVYDHLCDLRDQKQISWKLLAETLDVPQSNISRIKNSVEGKEDGTSFSMLEKISMVLENIDIGYKQGKVA